MKIDAETKLYFLLGNPVAHSLSPALHNAAFQALHFNAVYLAAKVDQNQVGNALKGMRALQIAGANVTSPHKEAVIEYLDEVSEEARLIRSVNTIINKDGRLKGCSTDGSGFYRAMLAKVADYDPTWPVMIVGTGGAARAVSYTMAEKGVQKIYLVNRSQEKSMDLARLLSRFSTLTECQPLPLDKSSLTSALTKCLLIIYTLPLDHPLIKDLFEENTDLGKGKILYDLRYSPSRSSTMAAFEKAGGIAYNGADMLLWQAVEAFKIFTGYEAPLAVMQKALLKV